MAEWTTTGPSSELSLATCRAMTPVESAAAADMAKRGMVEALEIRNGLRITTRSYVGAIDLGPVVLQIRPKLADLSPAAMAAVLRYALGLDMLTVREDAIGVPLEDDGFVDLIALAVLEEVNSLLRAGLIRDYETHSGWRGSPRGRLDLAELARRPLRAQTALALPCRYTERTTDNALNRLVRAALAALAPIVTDTGIAFDLHARAALLGELCAAVPLSTALLAEAGAALDRRSHHYRPVVDIAALVVQGLGITVDESRCSAPLSGFLLNMNPLFERFLTRLVADFGPRSLRVDAQVQSDTAYVWRQNPYNWLRPRLRPDIIVRDAATGAARLVIDAKYKPFGPKNRPGPADLYQLTLYSMSCGDPAGHVPAVLVYPSTVAGSDSGIGTRERPELAFRGFAGGSVRGSVGVVGLPMLAVAEALRREDVEALRGLVREVVSG
jgi:5-methylcytosine-specific restriction enzyme subunit McrC